MSDFTGVCVNGMEIKQIVYYCNDVSYSSDEGFFSKRVEREECISEDSSTIVEEKTKPIDVVLVENEEVYQEGLRRECESKARHLSSLPARLFQKEIGVATRTFKASNLRDRYVEIANRNAILELASVRDKIVADPICSKYPDAYREPIEWIEYVNREYDMFKKSTLLPNEQYQESALNIADGNGSFRDYSQMVGLVASFVVPYAAAGARSVLGIHKLGLVLIDVAYGAQANHTNENFEYLENFSRDF